MKVFCLCSLFLILVSCNPFDKRTDAQKVYDAKLESLDDDTLLGPDKNGDGVRDDIEYWIKDFLKDDIDLQKASFLYAKSWREIFKVIDDREKSVEKIYEKGAESDCMRTIVSNGKKYRTKGVFPGYNSELYDEIIDKIIKLTGNSRKRLKAYAVMSVHFRGHGRSLSVRHPSENCSFELTGEYHQ